MRMLATLRTPQWMTPLPLPTVGQPATIVFLPDPPKRIDHLGQAYNMWRGMSGLPATTKWRLVQPCMGQRT